MLLEPRCDIMLASRLQCGNPVVEGSHLCRLHEQFTEPVAAQPDVVNETQQPTASDPNQDNIGK